MFALVALLCLYSGGNNIRKAFALAPFGQWEFINWALFSMGIILLIVGVLCVLQANKDLKERTAEIEKQQEAEKKKRQREFFYDEDEKTAEAVAEEIKDMES